MKKPKVHPVAELFPMMSDEELDDLAQDIRTNGLLHPIVLDETGMLIDGRNRFEACKRAGIEPACETLNGQDPVAFIMAQNDKRRHMTKGQRAMVAAQVRLLTKSTVRETARQVGTDLAYIGRAAIVLDYAPELRNPVVVGELSLNEAYERAVTRKREAESDEGKMRRLRKHASDLADQVTEEKLTLAEAIGALEARLKEEETIRKRDEEQRQLSTTHLETLLGFANPGNWSAQEKAERFLRLYDRRFSEMEINSELLSSCAEVLRILAKKWSS